MNDPRKVLLPYWLQLHAPVAMKSGLPAPPSDNPWPQISPWTQPLPLVPAPRDGRLLGGHGILSSEEPPRATGGILGQLLQPSSDDPSSLTQSRIQWPSSGQNDSGAVISDIAPDNEWIPGAQYAGQGHHFLPQALWRKLPLAPETRKVFDKETSGHLHIRGHANDKAHRDYSDATEELMDRFMNEHNIKPEDMTPDQARSLLKTIEESQDPRIRNYRQYIQRLLLRYQLRTGSGRGNE
jgi:hypothetical protein